MASQQRRALAQFGEGLQEDEILQELDQSEGDFSASDDDETYFLPQDRDISASERSSSSETEAMNDSVAFPESLSPALSLSSYTVSRRNSIGTRRRTRRARGTRIRALSGRGRGMLHNNETTRIDNTWTGRFNPSIHFMHSPNYLDRSFNNFQMFDFFDEYIDDSILDKMVSATNQTEMMKHHKNLGITNKELKTFFGINMIMASIGYPKIKMYWEKSFRLPIIADNMTRDRYFLIRTRLKVVFDNDVPDNQRLTDKIWKVRPLFDRVLTGCYRQPRSEHISIDEMIIPFSGQCSIRQYCPNKPNPVGLKVFVLANPNGCICDMKVYEGSTTFPNDDGFNLGESAVLHLTTTLVPGHYLYFDRYFSTKKLMEELNVRGYNATGTIMKNRVPRECIMMPDNEFSKQNRGTTEVVTSQDGKIAITKWLDNKPVLLISTCLANEKTDICKRWDKRNKRYVQVPRPEVIKMYNTNMGGVDLADRMIAVCPIRARTRKWTIRFIFHMIDISVSNSWITYREQRRLNYVPMHKIPQLREYKFLLGTKLIQENTIASYEEESFEENMELPNQQKKRRVTINPLPTIQKRTSNARHIPKFTKIQQRCRNEGCNKKTTAKCRFCRVYLCLNSSRNCFAFFHGYENDSESD